jgi:L-lactate dehydrogenase complex protein LldG
MSDSRRAILDRIRTRHVEGPELPQIDPDQLIHFDDLPAQFVVATEAVGAACHRVAAASEVAGILQQIQPFRDAKRIASMVPEAVQGNTDLRMYDDPHYMKGLDWMIARGAFGVAENGAIWMDMENVPHRASLFITQFLAIVVPANQLVPHMHAAYQRIGEGIKQSFGVFVAGPSKTADIEQSLVLGAHGCRTLNVFLVDSD